MTRGMPGFSRQGEIGAGEILTGTGLLYHDGTICSNCTPSPLCARGWSQQTLPRNRSLWKRWPGVCPGPGLPGATGIINDSPGCAPCAETWSFPVRTCRHDGYPLGARARKTIFFKRGHPQYWI